jgi:HlyD family secretion protein
MSAGHLSISAVLCAALAFGLAACGKNDDNSLQGWVEADFIFVSPDEAGRVDILNVREGDTVAKGAVLFTVDPDLQQADYAAAKANLTNAQQAFDRAQALLKSAAGTQKNVEDTEAALRSAQARLNSAKTRLERRTMKSPVAGTVQQVYYREGETVPAGRPVLALLPLPNLKIRFYAPQAELPIIKIGDPVVVSCDNCEQGLTARVTFISRTNEFTPPVIYSLEERAKLVYLIEAHPDHPEKFRVGQPVSVRLAKGPNE